jgi:hypothetical protein
MAWIIVSCLVAAIILIVWRARHAIFTRENWPLLLVVPALLVLTTAGPDEFRIAVLLFAILAFAMAWFHEFRFLMRLNDDAFPGRNDKLIWALLLMFFPPVGAVVFWSFRRLQWPASKPAGRQASRELS